MTGLDLAERASREQEEGGGWKIIRVHTDSQFVRTMVTVWVKEVTLLDITVFDFEAVFPETPFF